MKTIAVLFALVAIAAAYPGYGSSYVSRKDANIAAHGGHGEHHDYVHYPAYKYEYGVHDPKTKDHKSQWEHRDGDKVTGEYTLDEADGTKRIVKYSSDKHGGFTAHVERVGHAHHPSHYHH